MIPLDEQTARLLRQAQETIEALLTNQCQDPEYYNETQLAAAGLLVPLEDAIGTNGVKAQLEEPPTHWESPEQAALWCHTQEHPVESLLQILRTNISFDEFAFSSETLTEFSRLS